MMKITRLFEPGDRSALRIFHACSISAAESGSNGRIVAADAVGVMGVSCERMGHRNRGKTREVVMHCGVMVTGYNQGDWERLLAEDYSRPPAISDAANMDETLAMGELVEPLGFDSIWATEHYGSAYSMQPNPLQYLAYWAGRTSRVDMGTAVIVAPWWNPVRLASEISMLDILLKGRRLHLGIGRGISPHEYASLGYPIGESHAYFYDV